MLMASKVIVKSLKHNLDELKLVRTTWTEEYATELEEKIDHAIDTYVGLDKKKSQRQATRSIATIHETALRDLSFLKTQIEVDFGDQAQEVINTLGYNKNLVAARNGDQEALIELLYRVKNGLTDELQSQMIANGTNQEFLDQITNAASAMSQANTTQEGEKTSTKETTQIMQVTYNEIFREVIGICKIASSYYLSDPLKKEQFTFRKVVNNMNSTGKEADSLLN